MNTTNKEQLTEALIDVRRAFRLLHQYQKHVLSLIHFIQGEVQCYNQGKVQRYNYSQGRRHFISPIRLKRNEDDYANLDVRWDMWGWDYLYGYLYEYYFDALESDRHQIWMSIIQVSDDGRFKSEAKSLTNLEAFAEEEESSSYLILNVSIAPKGEGSLWLRDPEVEAEQSIEEYLHSFIASENLYKCAQKEGRISIQCKIDLCDLGSLDEVKIQLRNFAQSVMRDSGLRIFKDEYYA